MPIAIRFKIDNEVNVYIFNSFKKFREQIEQNIRENPQRGAEMDGIYFGDFQTLLSDLRCEPLNIYPMGSDYEGICEDGEELESDNDVRIDEVEGEM